jgi:poly-beta-1,6-N-acetyl-D-glucosamine N-deacetylase
MMRLAAAAAAVLGLVLAPAVMAAESAVILMYHRFGEDSQPTTNIKLAEFEAHIRELTSGPYSVLPLLHVLSAIREGRALPERTVAITIDDGYASAYTQAWPRLRDAKLPFTLFLSTAPIDARNRGMMTWEQIRELAKAGVGIGAHTITHLHMVEASEARNKEELMRANKRIAEETGKAAEIFAYPYGETSREIMRLTKEAGYRFALGDHSGVADPTMDDFYIPRFGMNESYSDLARLRLVLNALPVPATDLTPNDPLLARPNPPNLGFTLAGDARASRMSCFASSEGRVKAEVLGERRVEVRFAKALPAGKTSRINCTMPGPDGRWRWFGTAFYVPKS